MKQDLHTLAQRFADGLTDVDEERRLFAAFAPGRRVPADLEHLRPEMQWYASLLPAAKPRRRLSVTLFRLGAAAAVAMIVTVAVGYFNRMATLPDDYLAYTGSYVIRNGEKITDLSRILPEIRRVDDIVTRTQATAANVVAGSVPSAADAICEGVDMDDPEVRRVMERAFR